MLLTCVQFIFLTGKISVSFVFGMSVIPKWSQCIRADCLGKCKQINKSYQQILLTKYVKDHLFLQIAYVSLQWIKYIKQSEYSKMPSYTLVATTSNPPEWVFLVFAQLTFEKEQTSVFPKSFLGEFVIVLVKAEAWNCSYQWPLVSTSRNVELHGIFVPTTE